MFGLSRHASCLGKPFAEAVQSLSLSGEHRMHDSLTLHPLSRVLNGARPCGRRVRKASQDRGWEEDSGNLAMLLNERSGDRHPAAAP